ncbi:transcription initiation factor TFIID subunit 4 isoform X1 [Drosophila bipectinata]|uniref:transcription initiation factor TFIID subunit 4 isoform X1 n=1 Tax=Drosophila bipectinata TaxID=42026 RepID=UPI001C89547B|nr:transcription initiation factor TFIID subunit 4 isoform X1 [Drosophila bipectinata]XP_017098434.2 transcription initiation factor TFIID subunit 4 isoform X1 [Drosophila bipectinata]XP_017098435.2 transcription initiation factor TFIID subunit 4 isoform X1 [Drosophila bipectinata]
MNTSQTAAGNRITFTTSQPLANGTINIAGNPGAVISTAQLPNTTTIKTIQAGIGAGQHPGLQQSGTQQTQSVGATQTQTLVIKSNHHAVTLPAGLVSSAPAGIVTMTKTINQAGQPLLNSMLPAGVVVGMRHQAPSQQQPKNVPANPISRVVINSHMAGVRPQSPSITLSTLNTGQTPALLVKTDNGFQLLRVGTTTGPPTVTQTVTNTSNNSNNNNNSSSNNNTTSTTNLSSTTQIRLQTVPAAAVSRYQQQQQQQQQSQQQQQQQSQQQQQQQQQQSQQQASSTTATTTSIALRKTIVRTSSTIPSSNNNNNNNNSIINATTTSNTTTTTTTNNSNKLPATNQQQHHHHQQKLHQQQQHLKAQQQQQQKQQQQASAAAAAAAAANVAATIKIKQNSLPNTTASNNIIVNSVAGGYSNASQPPHLTQLNSQAPHLPQITQIQTIPAQANNTGTTAGSTTTSATTTTTQQGNTKEKCRKFLANLIELSTREPKPVEKNVRTLIQELVNANVEPEEFCDRLERLLNASPQPCLIGFLKKSLPLLRQALFTKELVIEGIKPPPQHVLGLAGLSQQLPKIQAQIRPIGPSQTTTIGQTQVRMITPNALNSPRPTIGHTTISKQSPNIRLPTTPRLVSTGAIRSQIPSLQVPGQANIVQIRGPQHAQLQRTGSVQIRATTRPPNSAPNSAGKLTAVKVGQTQIKAITPSLHPPSLAAISGGPPPTPTLSVLSTINSASSTSLPVPSLPTVHLPPEALRAREQMQNSLHHNNNNHFEPKLVEIKAPSLHPPHMERINASLTPIGAKTLAKPSPMISKAASKKRRDGLDGRDADGKLIGAGGAAGAATTANSFFQQSSMSTSMYGDDDINDVAAMGGVNLAEESQRILGCTENIGTQIRSCKDEVFLNLPALQARIRAITTEAGLDEPTQDVAVLISHACQERLKNIVEKLAVIAEHRIDVIKLDPRYETAKDVRGQIKFLEELDKAEQKRHEELEREMLLRAAKSRSRVEDPEQAKMKARAKEMQRAEMEELRQRDANLTALQAIGPRKKLKLDGDAASAGAGSSSGGLLSSSGSVPTTLRPRIKRVNLRDMLFYMEQEREFCRSTMLFKTYLK